MKLAYAIVLALAGSNALAQIGAIPVLPASRAPAASEPGAGAPPRGGADSAACYANCDNSIVPPAPGCVNVLDIACFMNAYSAALSLGTAAQIAHYANCDESTVPPVLNVNDFACFLNKYAAGCTSC